MDEQRIVIAGDVETGEEYLARIVDDGAHGHDPPPRPIVQILRVVKYPRQQAIAHPEIAMEFPPIEAGTMCRMDALREPTKRERARMNLTADEARSMALVRAIDETESEEEREILRRHAAGEYGRRRVIVTFSSSNIAYLEKYSQGMEAYGLPEGMGELPGGH